ncbi:hypothetical protein C942_02805 [Photobacterium marinum]|uniref:Uncharacterized protein n=1 Tax=Photobacterium marinum TaxID=1056511 RepID=L8J7S9_9GAMM|nr:hypothetical protein C942_02805 [Photobacterium marinum]
MMQPAIADISKERLSAKIVLMVGSGRRISHIASSINGTEKRIRNASSSFISACGKNW